jgi:single-stranded-DNA-specific exonuclease
MLARNRQTARKYADELEVCNLTRREYDQKTAEEAETLHKKNGINSNKSIVLYQPHWHKGVIGIVASRIAEKYHKPTIILTQSEGNVVGSARSVSQFDIHEVIESCSDILINYGGHKYAAGMTLAEDQLDAFMRRFEAKVANAILPKQQIPQIDITTEIKLSDISPRLWKELELFAPFGPGNPQPIFMSRGVRDAGYSKQLSPKHLRLAIRQNKSRVLHGMAFAQEDLLKRIKTGEPFDICFTIQKNTNDRRHPFQLLIHDIRFAEVPVE